jgi:hypothetical protein
MAGRECDIAEFVTDAQLLGQSVCPAQEMLRSGPRPRSPVLLDSRQVGRRLRIDLSPRPHVPHSLAPGSQTVRYLPWLKVSVALRYVRTFPGHPKHGARSGNTYRGCWLNRAVFARPGGSIEAENPVMNRRTFLAGTGAVLLAAPIAAEAQPVRKLPRVGLLSPGSSSDPLVQPYLDVFRRGLRDLGYVEGQSIIIE